jgi:hypothetical protein
MTHEILDLELKQKSPAIDGLYLELGKELSYIDELKNLRATANRLVDNGKDKAILIVRQLDTKLKKQSSRAHSILSDIEELEERVEFLQHILAQCDTTYSDSQIKNIILNRQSAFFAAIPISELPVPGDIHEFCPELASLADDSVFWTPALKPIVLLRTPDISTLSELGANDMLDASNWPQW